MQQYYYIYQLEDNPEYVFTAEERAGHEEDPDLEPMIETLTGRALGDARRALEEIRAITPWRPV